MTSRLPVVGGDSNDWGTILNDFLGVSHDVQGNLLPAAVSAALPSPIPAANLGSGTPSGSNFLRGDGTWATPSGGGDLLSTRNLSDVANAGTSRANLGISALTAAAACGNNTGGTYNANGGANATFTPFSGYVDGYYANVGDLILLINEAVNNQTGSTATAAANGLWQVQKAGASGTWVRPAEFVSGLTTMGRSCTVLNGTLLSGSQWVLQAPTGGVTVDTSNQTWIAAGTQYNYLGAPASNTTYAPGDILLYKGGRILVTKSFTTGTVSSTAFPWISAANYVGFGATGGSVIMASDYGIVGDNTTDNGVALNNLIQEVSGNGGGNIYLPPGVTATSIPIVIYTDVHLWGTGFNNSELRLLAGANCDVVQFYKSSDASISNAFFSGLWNLEVNGNRASQSATDFHMGVNLTTNPISSGATHDLDFDPSHILCNVKIKNVTGHAWYAASARDGMRLIGVWVEGCGGHAFYSGTDTEYESCHAEGAGLAGWYIQHSSAKGAANKSYNNGTNAMWSSGSNYSAGTYAIYSGNLYRAANAVTSDTVAPSADTTNWVNVAPAIGAGYGWYFDGGTATESAWSACDAQQNAAGAIYMHNCGQVNFHGSVSQVNTGLGIAGGSNQISNPNYYSAVTLDNSSGCIVSVVTQAMQNAYILRLVNGAAHNDVHLAGDTTAAATLSPDTSSLVGSGNAVSWNGAWLSDVTAPVFAATGLAGATASSRYAGATASGAPVSGTFAKGDYVIDQTGVIWICTAAGSPGTWTSVSGGGGSTFNGGLFGDGSNSTITLDGSTSYANGAHGWISGPAGSIYTLVQDIYVTSLTINSGITLATGGFRIFCTGTLTNNGTISGNGANGSGSAGGSNTPNYAPGGSNSSGGNGSTGNGSSGAGGVVVGSSNGGSGGAGSSGTGGAAPSGKVANWAAPHSPQTLLSGSVIVHNQLCQIYVGMPGGGGGGDGTSAGGGGGAGGHLVLILANTIVNNGVIQSLGGNGAPGTGGNAGGGGGGSAGAVITYSKSAVSGSGSMAATPGTGGAGSGTGVAGTTAGIGAVTVLNVVLS